MGWTYFPSNGRSTIDLLKQQMVCDNDHGNWQWLDHALQGSVVYAVMTFTPKGASSDTDYVHDADGSFRFIAVFLTDRASGEHYDFGYKDITETMGPYEQDCPARLLDLASPFHVSYQGCGRAWRAACRAKCDPHRQVEIAVREDEEWEAGKVNAMIEREIPPGGASR